jgi:hypothetical protein
MRGTAKMFFRKLCRTARRRTTGQSTVGPARLVLLLAVLNVVAWAAIAGAHDASADHAFSGGDCWQAGTPTQCAASWGGAGTVYYYYESPYWDTGLQSEGGASLSAAVSSWTNAAGPQIFTTSSPGSPYMNVFTFPWPTYSAPASVYTTALTNGAIATTANYSTSGTWCVVTACAIDFSSIYYNTNARSSCGSWSAFTWQYIFAHEFGHSQGLADHTSGSILMNQSWTSNYPCSPDTSVNGPTSTEEGTPVHWGDSACGSTHGVQCIFKWPNT